MPNVRTANAVRLEFACWLVLYDAPGADRKEGGHTVFGDLLRRD